MLQLGLPGHGDTRQGGAWVWCIDTLLKCKGAGCKRFGQSLLEEVGINAAQPCLAITFP